MRRLFSALIGTALAALPLHAQQPTVHIEPSSLQGPRVLKDETKTAIVRDYLEAWQSLRAALEQNRPDLLNRDFVGTAKEKLAGTISDQVTTGISTRYLDQSHDLQIIFYSPEGLSVQLVDNVTYNVQLVDHGKVQGTQTEQERYVVVMTPAELRWRVRIFQGQPE